MQNSPQHNSDATKRTRNETELIIKKHWSNLLGCSVEDFSRGLVMIGDSVNPRLANTKKSAQEIQIFEYENTGIIINTPDSLEQSIQDLISQHGVDMEKIGKLLQNTFSGRLEMYPSVRSYLFDTSKLLPKNPNVRKLSRNEKPLFKAFMAQCSEEVRHKVYMDFDEAFHNFFAYMDNGEVAALGEFSKINPTDTIALPSIITLERHRSKGYGKAVINVISHEILEQGLVPQYRCNPENHSSRAIAKSLGYEEIVRGVSMRIISENGDA